ncbi:TM0106 family RecB-like putative nuclease [Brachybacterium sp. EF45031]|uniref:TM0106 family RecB-like putative nuclease n=1 Tax=Brachybacterium sillae TaxID=2810536 RepID=UPI00217D05C1|nr:TM0106 family RecB-like putative nuclease [Brachybacterium sillae]MCS6711999.1 TM0106 family RecB-like putative nuclease [Brachybacterium sillae]
MVTFAPDRTRFMLSPSDLTAAATCEYGWLRLSVDPKLGRAPRLEQEDAFLERVSALGDTHEQRALQRLIAQYGADQVVQLPRPEHYTPDGIAHRAEQAAAALRSGIAVVFQAMLHDGEFGGLADFLVRIVDADHPHGAYRVVDTKLARHARVTALLQIAAYADQLDRLGIPHTRDGVLWLGDDTEVVADLDEIIPVYRHQRERLTRRLREHVASGEPARWGDDRLGVCGQCEACTEAIAAHRDVLLTAGATRLQRTRLRAAGITTIEDLAASTAAPADMPERTWRGLREQASLQLQPTRPDGTPPFVLTDTTMIRDLPAPSPGDMFFDFEGDPLWTAESGAMEGLEYLWGWVETPDGDTAATRFDDFLFTGLWADSRAEERAALERFVETVEMRRLTHPDMRIYHYAPYEVTALKRLTVRHGVGERELDSWLRAGLFIDLYSVVRGSLRAGVVSYSIKKLEPLYMGSDHRSEDGVTTAADSVTEYHAYTLAREAGDEVGAARLRAGIEDYNRYDCVSTARLRDWLLREAAKAKDPVDEDDEADVEDTDAPVWSVDEEPPFADEDGDLERLLLQMLPARPDPVTGEEIPLPDDELDDEQRGLALLAAALGFHQREAKPQWWAFFDRAISPVDEWQDPRANLVADRVEILEDWHTPPRARTRQRVLRMRGTLEPGSSITPGAEVRTVYEDIPAEHRDKLQPNALRWIDSRGRVEDVEDLPDGTSLVVIRERLGKDAGEHSELPMAAFAHQIVPSGSLQQRLRQIAEGTLEFGHLPMDVTEHDVTGLLTIAGSEVLARRTPHSLGRPLAQIAGEVRATRQVPGGATGQAIPGAAPASHREPWEAVVEALRAIPDSYVAVQGPPGTGKTHVGSHAVKALVEQGWRIGVTAQSHAVIENFLTKLVGIGVPAERVGKTSKSGSDATGIPWTDLTPTAASRRFFDQAGGWVLGGTAWTFAKENSPELDLLVIDEAGQFSLANTLAGSVRAHRLLLLGDPQQLPQVTQGTHPQPVGDAALAWLLEDDPVLRPDRGFFLDTTWRMHSALTTEVSRLSYGGQLGARADVTDARHLEGIAPGLHPVPVTHDGNAVASPEEAEEVVRIARDLLGRGWTPGPGESPRPLRADDIIVVAPYNAQVATVRRALDEAGLTGTTVGTVDRFQGREAAVAILTMAASSATEVPRGLDFLLSRNRLNVSISRGQWAAYLVHSPALADVLPTSAADLPMVGAFLRLIRP